MSSRILEIFKMAHSVEPRELRAGPGILNLLKWDKYQDYLEIDTNLNYVWKVETAMYSPGDCLVRARQTIFLEGYGIHRKHECVLAFSLKWIDSIELEHLPGEGGGAWRPRSGSGSLSASDYLFHGGNPTGLRLSFKTPVAIRRWSCLPITSKIIEQEVNLFEITLWMPTPGVAHFARDQLLEAINECGQSESPFAPYAIPAPSFDDVPDTPPGSIRR